MRQYVMNLSRWMGALTAIALFAAWSALVSAQETVIPPEAHWTATPPASRHIDSRALAELLLEKGVISPQEMARLPQLSTPSQQGRARVWTWDEIDHNPVKRAGASQ